MWTETINQMGTIGNRGEARAWFQGTQADKINIKASRMSSSGIWRHVNLEKKTTFRRDYLIHLQGRNVRERRKTLAVADRLNHIQKGDILHNHSCENLKSDTNALSFNTEATLQQEVLERTYDAVSFQMIQTTW
jgi:hypothetical protein